MTTPKLCTRCGSVGPAASSRAVLWVLFGALVVASWLGYKLALLGGLYVLLATVPGAVLVAVAAATRTPRCATCGEPRPVPLDSPAARRVHPPR